MIRRLILSMFTKLMSLNIVLHLSYVEIDLYVLHVLVEHYSWLVLHPNLTVRVAQVWVSSVSH